jgi:hypothetical protein
MGYLDNVSRAATTATVKVNTVVGGVNQATSSVAAITQSAAAIKSSALNGLTNVGTGVAGSLAGVANAANGIAAGVNGIVAGVNGIAKAVGTIAGLFSGADIAGNTSGTTEGNPLHKYASYTYMFGLYALADEEVNSGARGAVGATVIQMPTGPTVGYTTFIDNVRLSGVIGLDQQAGNSNSSNISFRVIEPYSMGKFWETLQTAALLAGHANYADAPYMLQLEFKGHFNADQILQTIPQTTKYFHIKIRTVEMKVTAKGATYDIEAYPWSEQGQSDSFAEIKTDVSIACNKNGPYTVADLLSKGEKSLKEVINKKLKDDKDRKKNVTYAHEIDIVFPPAPYTSNENGNAIGLADLGLGVYNKAGAPFSKDNATYDPATGIYKRGDITIDTKNADFKFAQGAKVQDIINQVIMTSDYGRKALEEANQTPDGKVVWWRVETHLHNISSEDPKTGQKAKKVIFRVVPYQVDSSIFLPPNTKSKVDLVVPKREFNYIYTGQNHDILDFQIEYKLGFFKQMLADGGKNSEDKELAAANSSAYPAASGAAQPQSQPAGGVGPEALRRDAASTRTAKHGGASGPDDAATTAARQFHDLATTGYDMQNLTLKILGDPYFIGDSGAGNFTIPSAGNGINEEGSIDWQKGQVMVRVNFRTPDDANTDTGFYDFGNTSIVKQFSGLFRAQEVTSEFTKGKFTQTLGLIRIQGQDSKVPGNYPVKQPMPNDSAIGGA